MQRTPSLLVTIALSLVLLVPVGWLLFERLPPSVPEPTLASAPQGGDFTLVSAAGPVSLSGLRGKVVLIYFGYTWCPDICPTNLAIIAHALGQLTPEVRERVQVLFVSVDPERDDPERLRQYTAYFHPGIIGLTGTPEQLAEVAARYGAAYRRVEQSDSALGYLVDHSANTALVDPEGRLVGQLPHATAPERIVERIHGLLGLAPAGSAGPSHSEES
ncbi:SCO family protein [Marichromatium gracile]|uniref:Electron transporter SenC n=1 Tax=Marichromatium gracile TaxID=1048 RepID=A0ABR5VGW5_MARGR|nr:SCO family protein [Marichromatium gracile]KXX64944.1 electron transporter SenC [Marichromatium gracile]